MCRGIRPSLAIPELTREALITEIAAQRHVHDQHEEHDGDREDAVTKRLDASRLRCGGGYECYIGQMPRVTLRTLAQHGHAATRPICRAIRIA